MPVLYNALICTAGAMILFLLPTEAAARSDAERLGRDLGRVAGHATFCDMDFERVNAIEVQASINMSRAAEDGKDLIEAQERYAREKARAARREPSGGCASFLQQYGGPAYRGQQSTEQLQGQIRQLQQQLQQQQTTQ